MGCTWSSNRVAHGKVNEDCSKDASPSHGKVESSGGQPILIVWDLNAVPAPMEPEILHSFVAALRKVRAPTARVMPPQQSSASKAKYLWNPDALASERAWFYRILELT